jgi:GntR family transcriptional regulator
LQRIDGRSRLADTVGNDDDRIAEATERRPRQLAERYQVNPLTAAKAYRELRRDGLTEKRRGEGLAVLPGTRSMLLQRERAKFLKDEWPTLRARLRRMEIDLKVLLDLSPSK